LDKKRAELEKFNPQTEKYVKICEDLKDYPLDGTKDFLFKCKLTTPNERAGTLFVRSPIQTGEEGYVAD
jgi:hypothetical protein